MSVDNYIYPCNYTIRYTIRYRTCPPFLKVQGLQLTNIIHFYVGHVITFAERKEAWNFCFIISLKFLKYYKVEI